MMTKHAPQLLLATALLVTAAASQAETYRWIDENGIVNYSERKPRGVDESRLTVLNDKRRARSSRTAPGPAPVPTPGIAPPSAPAELSAEQQRMLADLEEKEVERQAEIAKIRDDNCIRARRVLENLSARSRIRVNEADGTQRVLPEEERQERIAEAQRGIVENCQ